VSGTRATVGGRRSASIAAATRTPSALTTQRLVAIRLGCLDQDPGIRSQAHQFVAHASAVELLPDDGLPRFAERLGTTRAALSAGSPLRSPPAPPQLCWRPRGFRRRSSSQRGTGTWADRATRRYGRDCRRHPRRAWSRGVASGGAAARRAASWTARWARRVGVRSWAGAVALRRPWAPRDSAWSPILTVRAASRGLRLGLSSACAAGAGPAVGGSSPGQAPR
jgi:hypothetical protein